ncbi:MAG: hypothetical protein ACKOQY_03530 [Bacteroidota bacterium]
MRTLLLAILILALPNPAPASRLRQVCDSLEALSLRTAMERDSVMLRAESLQVMADSCEARAMREAAVHRRLNFARQDAEAKAVQLQDFNDQLLLLSAVLSVILLFALTGIFLKRFLRPRKDKSVAAADLRIDRMHKLVRLRESGILSVDEAETLKRELLDGGGE